MNMKPSFCALSLFVVITIAATGLLLASKVAADPDSGGSTETLLSPGDNFFIRTFDAYSFLTTKDQGMTDPEEVQQRVIDYFRAQIMSTANPEVYTLMSEENRLRLSVIAQWALDNEVIDKTRVSRDINPTTVRMTKCLAQIAGGGVDQLMACAEASKD